jgi:hypothetical protein
MARFRVRLPSGKYADQVGLGSLNVSEVAYVVARFMWSHSVDQKFRGSIGYVLMQTWPNAKSAHGPLIKQIPKHLRANGFMNSDDASGFFWAVPEHFPNWVEPSTSKYVVEDDGSQTEGGPVREHIVTRQMDKLMYAIEDNPFQHARDYAVVTGASPSSVSHVAGTLEKYGYIERKGKRAASRYLPTGKAFPHLRKRNGGKKVVVVKAQPETKPPSLPVSQVPEHREADYRRDDANKVEEIEEATGGTVVFTKDGDLMVVKDGKLYLPKPVTTWNLEEF